MTPAERVRLARQKRKFSQRELSSLAKVAPNYVYMLERSLDPDERDSNEQIKVPGLEHLQKLAEALGVPVGWLAFGTEPEPEWGDEVADTERPHQ